MEDGQVRAWIGKLWRDEQGQDLVEFTLLAAFVALGSSLLLTPCMWRSLHAGSTR
jgi:hypothetical protein